LLLKETFMRKNIDMFFTFFKIGLFTFGGGYAMLPMLEKEIIGKKDWSTEDEIMNYYAISQCTPGIIAVNVATFVGYAQKGIIGGIICALGAISPSLIIITIIASVLANFQDILVVQHALAGIRIAVCVLMASSIIKMYRGSVKNLITALIFIGSLVLAYFTNISTVYLVIGAGLLGIFIYNLKISKEEARK